ncbi:hypothetical protein D3C80_1629340 [compost metagenome]
MRVLPFKQCFQLVDVRFLLQKLFFQFTGMCVHLLHFSRLIADLQAQFINYPTRFIARLVITDLLTFSASVAVTFVIAHLMTLLPASDEPIVIVSVVHECA